MGEFLRDHARKNVWCSPGQDTDYILKVARVSPAPGRSNTHRVMWENMKLPDTTSVWSVFQIGGIHPKFFNLLPIKNTWSRFSETSNSQNLICDVYNSQGICLSRHNSFYRYGSNRNLIVAVRKNTRFDFDFENGDIFLRLYTNAYYESPRSAHLTPKVRVESIVPINNTEIATFQSLVNTYKALPGAVIEYVNGIVVRDINILSAKPGDTLEFVYDCSVAKKVSFKIADLSEFVSILDSKRKYLLHHPLDSRHLIDFADDIDIVVIDKTASRYYGLLLNKNTYDTIRNVTHRDHSIPVAYVQYMTDYLRLLATKQVPSRIVDPMEMSVELYIRDSGYARPLVNEDSRIAELYKLPDIDVQRAMLGIDSTVPFWRAEELENSDYCAIMRGQFNDINDALVEGAYGYNAMAKLLSYSPVFTRTLAALKVADVPMVMQLSSTAFEYDVNGLLLGFYTHSNSDLYSCTHNTAHYVEFIYGVGDQELSDETGSNNVDVPIGLPYRVYMTPKVAGVPSYVWQDVTGDNSKYSVTLNKVVWSDAGVDPFILVRSVDKFLCYQTSIDTTNTTKLMVHQITAGIEISGVMTYLPLTAVFGRIDVFLNKRSLVRDVDYYLRGSTIVIINKEHLIDPDNQAQELVVRMYDFCKPDMTIHAPQDAGFVTRGVLSNNNRFDLREDRVVRLTVNGQLKDLSELVFYEDTQDVGVPSIFNGRPYQMTEVTTPLHDFISSDTYVIKEHSVQRDQIVRDYMTLKYPIVPPTTAAPIATLYKLYSPFINKVIHDTVANIIDVSTLGPNYSDLQIISKVQYLEYLLEFDPIYLSNFFDSNTCIIHPLYTSSVVDVNISQYRFIDRVVKLYAKRSVLINAYLNIV